MKRTSRVAVAGAVLAAALTVGLAAALSSAADSRHQDDVRATHSYVLAELGLFRTIAANSRESGVAAKELADQVAGECGGIAKGAPRNRDLVEETIDDAVLVFFSPDLAAVRADVRTLSRLRWSNRRLTALVRALAAKNAVALIAPTDLCGNWRSWVASGGKVLTPETRRIVEQLPGLAPVRGPELRGQIDALLRPLEGPREVSRVRRLNQTRARAGRLASSRFLAALNELAVALGLVSKTPVEAGPSALEVRPPAEVLAAGGKRREEFELGKKVTAASGCLACHRIGADGNRGPGPDLTHIGSTLTGVQIARVLLHPKPPMPSFARLPKANFDALVEFLSLLH